MAKLKAITKRILQKSKIRDEASKASADIHAAFTGPLKHRPSYQEERNRHAKRIRSLRKKHGRVANYMVNAKGRY